MGKYTDSEGCFLVGRIRLNSSTRVCDPCYDKYTGDVSGISRVLDTEPGAYDAYVMSKHTMFGCKIACLAVVITTDDMCSKSAKEVVDSARWKYRCSVGNDSGQMGIYSRAYFSRNAKCKEWYDNVCKITLGPEAGTTNGKGIVSSSGDGDGYYAISTIERNGKVIAIKVTFL